jgi:hypothetical protein
MPDVFDVPAVENRNAAEPLSRVRRRFLKVLVSTVAG